MGRRLGGGQRGTGTEEAAALERTLSFESVSKACHFPSGTEKGNKDSLLLLLLLALLFR
jgi:hypothetical protein